jgi:hypothetical protein
MPISMTPEQYFEAFTLGNYNDFLENQSSVMRAFNSAVAASHLVDCYYYFYEKNDPVRVNIYPKLESFIDYLSRETNNYFRDINSIANAYKHLYARDKKHPEYSTISSAGTIESIRFIDEEVERVYEEPIEKNVSEFSVFYTRKTGEQIQFKQAIEVVVNFWETIISKSEDLI